jgi:hypothetical protein
VYRRYTRLHEGGAMIVITAPTGLIGHQVLQNLLDSG